MAKRISAFPTATPQTTDYILALRAAGVRFTVQQLADLLSGTLPSDITVAGTFKLTCVDDSTEHAVKLRKVGSEYVLEVVQ